MARLTLTIIRKDKKERRIFAPIIRAADVLAPRLQRAATRAFTALQDSMSLDDIEELTQDYGPDAVPFLLPPRVIDTPFLTTLRPVLKMGFDQGGTIAAKEMSRALNIEVVFNRADLRAVQWAQQYSSQLVTHISEATRQGLRETISQALEQGLNPRVAARAILPQIGLTERQAGALAKYRTQLETEGKAAEEVSRLVQQRTTTQLRQRAENISITESVNALSSGQAQLYSQMQDAGLLPPKTMKMWLAHHSTQKGSPCPEICAPMDRQTVPLDQPFVTGDGREVMYPTAHPRCRCAYRLVFA